MEQHKKRIIDLTTNGVCILENFLSKNLCRKKINYYEPK